MKDNTIVTVAHIMNKFLYHFFSFVFIYYFSLLRSFSLIIFNIFIIIVRILVILILNIYNIFLNCYFLYIIILIFIINFFNNNNDQYI